MAKKQSRNRDQTVRIFHRSALLQRIVLASPFVESTRQTSLCHPEIGDQPNSGSKALIDVPTDEY